MEIVGAIIAVCGGRNAKRSIATSSIGGMVSPPCSLGRGFMWDDVCDVLCEDVNGADVVYEREQLEVERK